ncbi:MULTISPECIES: hypothetical protein [Rhizobium/Agrobacterium group]|uniref:hypothetical protein n=1 Tax=Rhizobium/Agrobacterium group TaxID=227290 RepID=UPI0022FFE2DB|nr:MULTISPECIES: hypothetical protein [Rhizobium/Agrobacterium group]MDA5633684.1 hypothetical protein [Agrobacterium sp. ST15.16.024]MDF1889330.1 hypothetical protein [Rhizobium rhizogenes]
MYTLDEEQMHFVSGGMGSRGGSGGGKSRGGRSSGVNRADKVNRDGTKSMNFGQTLGHIAGQMQPSISFSKDGPSISGTFNCSSCHDPARNSRNYRK